MKIRLLLLALLICVIGCASTVVGEKFVLTQLIPPELTPEPAATPDPAELEKEPVYVLGKIVQVDEERGLQVRVVIRFPSNSTGLEKGMIGTIFKDETMELEVGNCELVEEFPGLWYADTKDLIYTIDWNAFVRVQVE